MKTAVIVNPSAGNQSDNAALVKNKISGSFYESQGKGHVQELCERLSLEGYGRIVVGGGDGTINEAVTGLMSVPKDQRAQMAILPLGTANDFSKTLALEDDLDKALAVIDQNTVESIDIVRITMGEKVRYAANIASGGFVPRMTQELDRDDKNLWGPMAYAIKSIKTASYSQCYNLDVTLDGKHYNWDTWNLIVANGRFAGGGVPIAPQASPVDGCFEVYMFHGETKLDFLLDGIRSVMGSHDKSSGVDHLSGKKLEIRSRPPLPVAADGELIGDDSVVFEMVPKAIPMLVGNEFSKFPEET